jgi:osmotically inducible lipoprotein OsmB
MGKMTIPVALAGALVLAGCQGMDAGTGERTVGGAAIGAAGGAIIGALAGAPGTGAAIGALAGSSAGLLYDQYVKGEGK